MNDITNDSCMPQETTKHKNISICHANIQSLGKGDKIITAEANVKLAEIRTTLQLKHEFDVICLSETWLTDDTSDEDITLKNYELYRKDRKEKGGGVCVYINSSLVQKRRKNL